MLEVVSTPQDLTTWDPTRHPFYLELYGETRPVVDMAYAHVEQRWAAPQSPAPNPSTDSEATGSHGAGVYEYWWTIGHASDPQALRAFWSRLKRPAARVYLFFPLTGGWRVKEVLATVQYLRPVSVRRTLAQRMASWFTSAEPLVGDAAELAKLVPLPAAAGVGTVLSTVAKLQVNSIPQTGTFEWSVGKVTSHAQHHVTQGIEWTLPPSMFTTLGSRLTGSVAVSFIPARRQEAGRVSEEPLTFESLPLRAHAVVYGPHKEVWAPAENTFVELQIAPSAGAASANGPQGDH